MGKLTFKRYVSEPTGNPPVHWEQVFPAPLLDYTSTVSKVGYNPDEPENIRAGILEGPWREHPQFALVLARTINMAVGEEFFVSEQSIYSTEE